MSETESVREKLELTLVGIKAKAGCVLAAEFKITFKFTVTVSFTIYH